MSKKIILYLWFNNFIFIDGKKTENVTPSVENSNYSVDKFADVPDTSLSRTGFSYFETEEMVIIAYSASEGRDIIRSEQQTQSLHSCHTGSCV